MHRGWLVLLMACAPVVAPPPSETASNVTVTIPPPRTDSGPDPSASAQPSLPPTVDTSTTPALDISARDIRSVPLRQKPIVLTELQALESLIAPNSPNRAQLLKRAGDDYLELHRIDGSAQAAHLAIDRYSTLTKDYGVAVVGGDEALYATALEYELLEDLQNARKTYFELIQKAPTSAYVPHAYFAFGEMFFREAKTDPSKWVFAKQGFEEVMKFPKSSVAPWALLRLGQTAEQTGDKQGAQKHYAKLRADFPYSAATGHIGQAP